MPPTAVGGWRASPAVGEFFQSASLKTGIHDEDTIMLRTASLLAGMTGLLLSLPAAAALYRVGSGAGCTHATIQAAVNAAVASVEADEIRISQSQAYTQQQILIDQAQGVLLLAGGFPTCQSNAPAPGARTVLNGNGSQPVLRILDSANVFLFDLDVQGGRANPSGGGIFAAGTGGDVLSLSNTLVRSNQAFMGGGISIINTSAQSEPIAMQLLMFGNSAVSSNGADIGGGIQCTGATVMLFDNSHVSLNSTSGNGGGIHAQDCLLQIRSSGVNGAVLWGNTAGGNGGGLYLSGSDGLVDMYTIDPFFPARITTNTAVRGGGVAVTDGAQMVMYNANIENNTASAGGGGVLVIGGTQGDSRFHMQNLSAGGPAAAVNCADPEACNLVRGNRAIDDDDGERAPGAAVIVDAPVAYSAHATFAGTRIESNTGTSIARHTGNFGQIQLNGALLVRNDASGVMLDAPGTANSLVLTASTIASNLFGQGRGVIKGVGGCDPNDDERGSNVLRSIIWQPSHPLIEASSSLVSGCFRYLIGNDFSGLPASSERLLSDPLFTDINSANFRLALASPAIDFATPAPLNSTRDGGPRVFDYDGTINEHGPQDLGAYEIFVDRIFDDNFDGTSGE